jgi:phosphatidylinositol kinase/protein kinase (PI-3  family)
MTHENEFCHDSVHEFLEALEERLREMTDNWDDVVLEPFNGHVVGWKEAGQMLHVPFKPKESIRGFDKKVNIFLSAKAPFLIRMIPENEKASKPLSFIFKFGDDLRQDNLVLQLFKIMDRLWTEDGLQMEMVTYDVMETGFETGYIEFVE